MILTPSSIFCSCIVPVGALWTHTCTHTRSRTRQPASHEVCCESGTSPWPSSSLHEPLGSSYPESPLNLKRMQSPWARHLKRIRDWTKPFKSSLVDISDLIVPGQLCGRVACSHFPLMPLQWNAGVRFASGLYNVNSRLCLELMFLQTLAWQGAGAVRITTLLR